VISRPGQDGIYVVEQSGTVRPVVSGGPGVPVLDISSRTRASGERGLLSAVFAPDGGSIVALYTTRGGDTRVTSFALGGAGAAGEDGTVLLRVRQPFENHNGGTVLYDERGRLLVSLGDGGSAFDPGNRGQDPDEPLGSILRRENGRWETIAIGLRNPWRMAFDGGTGMLWIGDVGQDRFEEINAVYPPETGQPRINFGWAAYEGHLPLGRKPLTRGPLTWPLAGYPHKGGHCSVTGGAVYRGMGVPVLRGRYVYGDFCRGTVWSLDASGAERRRNLDIRREAARVPGLTSFGTDGRGELYAVSIQGAVSKIVPYS
jgi:glucose/arabinose dehydrogenase